jgi:hypothetical protein
MEAANPGSSAILTRPKDLDSIPSALQNRSSAHIVGITADERGTAKIPSPITSPPYWVQSHQRSFSNISVESFSNGGITLQDNTDGTDSKNEACWAKSVRIEGYVIVNASRTNIGAFVVWNIMVETLRVKYYNSSRHVPAILI